MIFLGRNILPYKEVRYAIRSNFSGIGLQGAQKILDKISINSKCKMSELTDEKVNLLSNELEIFLEEKKQEKLLELKMAEKRPKPKCPI